jgi:hypothetical protein
VKRVERFRERSDRRVQRLRGFGSFDEWFQRTRLALMTFQLQQVSKSTHGGIFVMSSRLRQLARISIRPQILDDLRDTVDARGLVKVAGAIQQRELKTRNLGESRFGL